MLISACIGSPDREIDKADTDGIIEFVNLKNPNVVVPIDSTNLENTFDFAEEISLNIEVDDKSQLTVVVDELNGDNIKVKGNAQLNAGITPSGQPYVLGLYEIASGSYDLTLPFLKRQFAIEKGSSLLWTGDPMQAEINITAVYKIEATVPKENESSKSFGKTPLDVLLKMSGNISNPTIDFDIRVDANAPSDLSEAVKNDGYLTTIKQNQVEMNKQVFALLISNNFATGQSSSFFSSINPEAIARQSVSKILSDQLDKFASDLIKGVDLDINLASSQGFFNGESSTRTDLSLGLSKAFFNNRIEVKVGRNFELENTSKVSRNPSEVFDNVSVNYKLTQDGRYLFRAFRKNQFQSVLEGFIVETGVGFSVTMEYRRFVEMFQKKRK